MARDGASADLMASIPLFASCTPDQLQRIASLAEPREASAGDVLTEEGTPGDEFFVIERGTATVTLEGRRLASLGPGDFFGEMALLDQGPRSATVTAETPLQALVVAAGDFAALLDEAPDVGKRVLRGVAERLRAVQGGRISPTA